MLLLDQVHLEEEIKEDLLLVLVDLSCLVELDLDVVVLVVGLDQGVDLLLELLRVAVGIIAGSLVQDVDLEEILPDDLYDLGQAFPELTILVAVGDDILNDPAAVLEDLFHPEGLELVIDHELADLLLQLGLGLLDLQPLLSVGLNLLTPLLSPGLTQALKPKAVLGGGSRALPGELPDLGLELGDDGLVLI